MILPTYTEDDILRELLDDNNYPPIHTTVVLIATADIDVYWWIYKK